jgi:hypothetical protein
MKLSPAMLFLEAAVLGLPITVLFVGALPMLFIAPAALYLAPSLEGLWFAVQLFCGGYAVVRYWHLAIRTSRGEPVHFGPSFWFAVASAVVAAFFLVTWSANSVPALLVVVAAAVGAAHFSAIQRNMRLSKSAPAQAQ